MTTPPFSDLQPAVDTFWYHQVLPQFKEYVRIKCISRAYVPDKEKNPRWRDALDAASKLIRDWIGSLTALRAQIHSSPEGGPLAPPPVLLVHVPGTVTGAPGSVLTYGHLDKQTVEGEVWTEPVDAQKKGPFTPNISDDHLYGRGTSDDGFATFTMITALAAMNQLGIPYPDVNLIIDFDEESGSENLASALGSSAFQQVIGRPRLAIELDSSIGDYQRLWAGASARGTITGTLSVTMLTTAVHSGDGGGVVPNPIDVLRLLLDRILDPRTGKVVIPEFQVAVPKANQDDAKRQVHLLGDRIVTDYPWWNGRTHAYPEPGLLESQLAKTWRAALAITGQNGLPSLGAASNVIVPEIQVQLSMRMPPSINVHEAQRCLKEKLEDDPPFGAKVSYDYENAPIGAGWVRPPAAPWFKQAAERASRAVFEQDPAPYSDGGTIPVLNLIGKLYGQAQILATGCAGPDNNEHGANENLNMGYARQLARTLARIVFASTQN